MVAVVKYPRNAQGEPPAVAIQWVANLPLWMHQQGPKQGVYTKDGPFVKSEGTSNKWGQILERKPEDKYNSQCMVVLQIYFVIGLRNNQTDQISQGLALSRKHQNCVLRTSSSQLEPEARKWCQHLERPQEASKPCSTLFCHGQGTLCGSVVRRPCYSGRD